MTQTKIRAVLFDFDGTLADSTELIMRSWRHMMQTHHGSVPPDEEWLRGFGMTLETQVARFARSPEEAVSMAESYQEYQRQHHDDMLRRALGPVPARSAGAGGARLAAGAGGGGAGGGGLSGCARETGTRSSRTPGRTPLRWN